jgi:SAM-dependent methyltransferase
MKGHLVDANVPKARDALGVPVPPVPVVRAANRAVGVLERLEKAMQPSFQLLLDRLFGMVDTKALDGAVAIGLPDLLVGGARTAEELAAEAGADPDAVERLLRYLVSRGFFERTRQGSYANNAASELLRKDHPWSWQPWVRFFGSDWNAQIWNQLPERVRTGTPATELAFGTSFFDFINHQHEAAGADFNSAMECGARVQAAIFGENIDLSEYRRVCDVGGGTGIALAHLLRLHPHLRGLVFDVPELAERAGRLLGDLQVSERADFVAGDFFEDVPDGADLYTMFAVIHDWDDASCVRILRNTKRAAGRDGRIMVVEKPLSNGGEPDFAKVSDMLMLMLGDGGRERTLDEYRQLFQDAGLQIRRDVTLPSLFHVFELE